jgi:hypothetical protein
MYKLLAEEKEREQSALTKLLRRLVWKVQTWTDRIFPPAIMREECEIWPDAFD